MGFCIKAKFDSYVQVHEIRLYDRVMFLDATTKYVCVYDDSSMIPCNDIDINASAIFERTINPQVDPRTYVCIKIKDKQREPLIIHKNNELGTDF